MSSARNRDYAILFGLLFWGLNVVDATVDAHLKDFDVSEDLSLRIKPTITAGQCCRSEFCITIGNNRPKNNIFAALKNSTQNMKIALIGYGKMGKAIEEIAVQRGHEIVLKVGIENLEDNTINNIRKADVAIEFTGPESAF